MQKPLSIAVTVGIIGASASLALADDDPSIDCIGSVCLSEEQEGLLGKSHATARAEAAAASAEPNGLLPCDEGGESCRTEDGRTIDIDSDYDGPDPTTKRWLHGFRIGAVYVFEHDEPTDPTSAHSSLKERYEIDSPWMFAIGYEGMRRIKGHSWLNVILVGNVTVVGLEQSKFIPSGNGLVGFEFDESFQLGVGANFTPEKDKPLHMIAAAGWTPRIGSFYMPVHFTVVPDVDGNHRVGSTIGVNW